ncbi:MAG: DUF1489 domain-containing protein [Alphaproteobacteria bacterium]
MHLIKICMGIDSIAHLRRVQAARLKQRKAAGEPVELYHMTRHRPRKAEEILDDGGSLYWIIKGFVLVRQPLIRFDEIDPPIDMKGCRLVYTPDLIPTRPQARRPFQGWRYLRDEDAPADAAVNEAGESDDEPPPEMAAELRALGLI